MKIYISLFCYKPYGGLSRDMLNIAEKLKKNGHDVRIYTESWNGEYPNDIPVIELKNSKILNHAKVKEYSDHFKVVTSKEAPDLVVGFNRMPGLDVYFAADVCFAETLQSKCTSLWRKLYYLTRRVRVYLFFESEVFKKISETKVLFLDKRQYESYARFYHINKDKYYILPPNISEKNKPNYYTEYAKGEFRKLHGIKDNDLLLIHVGSDFKRKGLDRTIRAIANYKGSRIIKLLIIGEDKKDFYRQLARELNVENLIQFTGGLSDSSLAIASSDALIHPARQENTGTVIVEALATGVPVVVSHICGFSHYVTESGGGIVIENSPEGVFLQNELNKAIEKLSNPQTYNCIKNKAKKFADTVDRKNMHDIATKIIEEIWKKKCKIGS